MTLPISRIVFNGGQGFITGTPISQADVDLELDQLVGAVNELHARKFERSGDVLTGPIQLSGDATQPLDPVTKQQWDAQNTSFTNQINSNDTDILNLQNDLGTETTNRTNADTNLQNQINQEVTDRTNADTNLQSQINTNDSDILALQNTNGTQSGDITNLQNNKLNRSGSPGMTGDHDMGGFKSMNQADGTASNHGATKGQVDSVQSNLNSHTGTTNAHNVTASLLGVGAFQNKGLVTSVGNPGSHNNTATEAAIRNALNSINPTSDAVNTIGTFATLSVPLQITPPNPDWRTVFSPSTTNSQRKLFHAAFLSGYELLAGQGLFQVGTIHVYAFWYNGFMAGTIDGHILFQDDNNTEGDDRYQAGILFGHTFFVGQNSEVIVTGAGLSSPPSTIQFRIRTVGGNATLEVNYHNGAIRPSYSVNSSFTEFQGA